MPKGPVLKAKGLFTHPNLLSEVPEGALVVAREVVIDREGVIQPRRGFSTLAGPGATINRLAEYQEKLILHSSTGTLSYHNGSAAVALTGSFPPPSATTAKTRFAQANQNLYFTTNAGPYKLAAYNGTPVKAGPPKAPGFRRHQYKSTAAIAGIARTAADGPHPAGKVTVTIAAGHNFYIGEYVVMYSAGEADFATGIKQVVLTPSATTFTYDEAGANVSSGAEQAFNHATLWGTSGFLAQDRQVAYRYCFVSSDANNPAIVGYVSPRTVVANASGTQGYSAGVVRNTVTRAFVPSTCTTAMKIRLYRSRVSVTTAEPSEEMFQVWEAPLKALDITRGWVDIIDIATDALLGPTLYTSPSQEGILQNNDTPPICKDLCAFDGGMLYANTEGPERYFLTLLGVGGIRGVSTDTVSITWPSNGNSPAFATSKEEGTAPTTGVPILSTGGASAGIDIRETALNFCSAWNEWAVAQAKPLTVYYLSASDDLPGKMVIELVENSSNVGPLKFRVSAHRDAWAPYADCLGGTYDLSRTGTTVTATLVSGVAAVPFVVGESVSSAGDGVNFGVGPYTVTAVTATTFTYTDTASGVAAASSIDFTLALFQASTNDAAPNRLYRSKRGQPEAVPAFDYEDVGSKDADILRVLSLRDGSAFIFKEDGLYRKSGYDAEPKLFDPTIILLAPDSAVTMGNQIYALTTQGVLAISETGSEVVSRPIEKTLRALQGASLTNLRNLTFGCSYESEHKYYLWTIASSADTTPTIAYVYNAATDSWVDTVRSRNHAIVMAVDDKLYAAVSTTNLVEKERKSFAHSDYADADVIVTVNSISGNDLALASASGLAVGDILTQGAPASRINAIVSNTITLASSSGFATGAATAVTGYQSIAQWAPYVGGDASSMKHWHEAIFLLGNAHIPTISLSMATELAPSMETAQVNAIASVGQWVAASGTWDGIERPFNLRQTVPQEKRRAARLNLNWTHRNAWGVWSIDGVCFVFNGGDQKQKGVR